MNKSFEEMVRLNLTEDIVEYSKQYEIPNGELVDAMDDHKMLAEADTKKLMELKEEYNKHISIPKEEIKANKKEWKAKRKELNNKILEIKKSEIYNLQTYNRYKEALDANLAELNVTVDSMKDAAENFILEVEQRDLDIINSLKISTLQNKVKINLKSYDVEKMGRNIRGGMTFGKGFKPRFFLSGSLVNKKQVVVTADEVFEIRNSDNFSIRVAEIAEFINVVNPENLENAILYIMKREKGSQYISEFLN